MALRCAGPEHDGIRFKEVDMHTRLSWWLDQLTTRLPTRWAAWGTWLRSAGARHQAQRADSAEPPLVEEAGTWGCGWFDSSHELVHGLQVEEDSPEALSALPLATWLDLELRFCSAAAPSA